MTDADDAPKPRGRPRHRDPVFDRALGARIQAARVAAKMSLAVLGGVLGISYQQMQKYEIGRDRVSASALAAIAAALGVHPGSFYDEGTPHPPSSLTELRTAQRIGERIARLRDPDLVWRLMALVDVLADAQDGATLSGDAKASGRAPDDADP